MLLIDMEMPRDCDHCPILDTEFYEVDGMEIDLRNDTQNAH